MALKVPREASADILYTGVTRELVSQVHPLQGVLAQQGAMPGGLLARQDLVGNLFGQQMPLRLNMEMTIVSKPLRLAPLPSSNLHAEVLRNTDTRLGLEDWLSCTSSPPRPPPLYHRHSVRVYSSRCLCCVRSPVGGTAARPAHAHGGAPRPLSTHTAPPSTAASHQATTTTTPDATLQNTLPSQSIRALLYVRERITMME